MTYTVFEGSELIGSANHIESAVAIADRAAQHSARSMDREFVVQSSTGSVYHTRSCGPEEPRSEIVGAAQERLQDEHAAGEHADALDVDCGTCRDEAAELGMAGLLPTTEYRVRIGTRRPQWNDWRCYRCGQLYPEGQERAGYHTTEAGYSFPFCESCDESV